MTARSLLAWSPGPVIACRLRTAAGGQGRARRSVGRRRAGHIWPVRLLPRVRLVAFLSWRRVDGGMQPAGPRGRRAWGFRVAVVYHPAALEPECGVNLAAAGTIIAVAEFIFADIFAIHPGPELGPECLRIPPGEELEQESFHCRQQITLGTRAFCQLGAAKSSASNAAGPVFALFSGNANKAAWTQSDRLWSQSSMGSTGSPTRSCP